MGVLVGVEEERVPRRPLQGDPVADLEAVTGAGVLLEHGQLLVPRHPHEVLRADPDEAHVGHHATGQDVVARAALVKAAAGEEHLLRADPHPDGALCAAGPRRGGGDLGAVHVDHEVVAGLS